MKKVTVDLLLGRNTKCQFKRTSPKTVIIKVAFPVGKAVKSPSLGTALSKYGLNTEEVLTQINNESKNLNWTNGIRIPILIYISPAKTFVLEYQIPTVYTLLNIFLNMDTKENTTITLPKLKTTLLGILYKIAIIKSQSLNQRILEKWLSQAIGSFNSCNPYDFERKLKKKI